MSIVDELFIAAPPEDVWALTADVERWPHLTPTMRAVHLTGAGPIGVGATARVEQPGLPAATWTVTEVEPPRRFAWQTTRNGVTISAVHDIAAADGGCRNRLSVVVSGRGASALALVGGPLLRRTIATENDGFRRAAEGLTRPAYVDEHGVLIDASPAAVWSAVERFADDLGSAHRPLLSRALGLDPSAGFAVAESVPPRLLGLAGRHRFSTYALDFRVSPDEDGTRLAAVTYADFPGPAGLAYRTAVIGTRGHVLAVRRMLRQIAHSV